MTRRQCLSYAWKGQVRPAYHSMSRHPALISDLSETTKKGSPFSTLPTLIPFFQVELEVAKWH